MKRVKARFFLSHCVDSDTRFYERQRRNSVELDFLILMVGIVAGQDDKSFFCRFADVFDGDVFFAAYIEAQQIHFAPENLILDVVQLFVQNDVATF